jgi:hypothetical protein
MFDILQVLTFLLVAVAMALALAHALELPGKMRLSKGRVLRDAADLLSRVHHWRLR